MALLIEDEKVIRDIEQLARERCISPTQVVACLAEDGARLLHHRPGPAQTYEEFQAAVVEIQDIYARNHDANDHRTDDEIIGYNEQGLFD